MKVAICCPCMDEVDTYFAASLCNLDTSGLETSKNFSESSLVYDSREKLAKYAAETADYALWIDSDMTFQPNALKKLLENDADIVSGLFFRRRPPYTPAYYTEIRYGLEGERSEKELTEIPVAPIELDATGMAFTLMRTKVLADCFKEYGSCFMPLMGYGEDISFCIRAKRLGYKIFLDPSVEVGHVAKIVIDRRYSEAWKAAHK